MLTEQEIIGAIPLAKGDDKRELLLQLCDFRSAAADAFWAERLNRPITQYLPYLCFSRSDAVSDFAAGLLEAAVGKIAAGNAFPPALMEEAWYAINLSFYKASDRMIAALEQIGRQYAALCHATFSMNVLLRSSTLPPYLRRQADLAYSHGCQGNFLHLVNDMLICTLVRSEEDFYDTVTRLAETYPDAFGYAGFFAAFVRDNAAAYAQYAQPSHLEHLLFTLGGLEYRENGTLCQYTPLWFYGVKNRIWQKKYELPALDERWIDFWCSLHETADEKQRQALSRLLFRFTELSERHPLMQEYFFQAAAEDTSECNLVGFMRCGGYDRTDELIQQICEMICQGRNNYHALFSVFDLLDFKKPEKLRFLTEARDYIEATDNRESWYAQRNHFLHAVKLYREGEESEFD